MDTVRVTVYSRPRHSRVYDRTFVHGPYTAVLRTGREHSSVRAVVVYTATAVQRPCTRLCIYLDRVYGRVHDCIGLSMAVYAPCTGRVHGRVHDRVH